MNKKGSRTVAAKWCHLRDNTTLRLAVQHRIKERKLKLMDLERATGIQAYRISRYLNKRKPHLNQFQLVNLCRYLNIVVKLQVEYE